MRTTPARRGLHRTLMRNLTSALTRSRALMVDDDFHCENGSARARTSAPASTKPLVPADRAPAAHHATRATTRFAPITRIWARQHARVPTRSPTRTRDRCCTAPIHTALRRVARPSLPAPSGFRTVHDRVTAGGFQPSHLGQIHGLRIASASAAAGGRFPVGTSERQCLNQPAHFNVQAPGRPPASTVAGVDAGPVQTPPSSTNGGGHHH